MLNSLKKLLLLSINFFVFNAISNIEMNIPRDPLASLNYEFAFDQSEIYKKYTNFIIKQGCSDNLNDECKQNITNKDEQIDTENAKKQFEDECFKRLQRARRSSLIQPAIANTATLSCLLLASYGISKILNKETLGGSINVLQTISSAAFFLPSIINSAYNVAYPPKQALNKLEDNFAVNKIYIPKELWPIITEKFMLARQNESMQRKCMETIEFLLGLTMYKPKPDMALRSKNIENIKNQLNEKIDLFFKDYELDPKESFIKYIKINVAKFIESLITNERISPRYILLKGPGGIGKTYFVNQLNKWIQELITDCVRFEELIITSSKDLEGNATQAGSVLKVLRNQLVENKRGSIIFIDEASWLNRESMIDCAKRVFNNDQSKLSINCFVEDGINIKAQLPPMLIFVAMNDNIKDPNLRSRFDVINYPKPTKECLVNHALEQYKNSKFVNNLDINLAKDQIIKWVDSLEENSLNFRYIDANVEAVFI